MHDITLYYILTSAFSYSRFLISCVAKTWLYLAGVCVPFSVQKLTDGGDQSVGEEHGGHQVPVGGDGGAPEDGDPVLVGRQHFEQKALERRGVDAALVQELLLQGVHVLPQLVLHRPLDAGENERSQDQVDDVEQHEAGKQQPRPAHRLHGSFCLCRVGCVTGAFLSVRVAAFLSLSFSSLLFCVGTDFFSFGGAVPIELEPLLLNASSSHRRGVVSSETPGSPASWILETTQAQL